MRGGKLPFSLHLYKEVCICDHRLKTDVIVALHLLVHVEVLGCAVTFIKTLKFSWVNNLRRVHSPTKVSDVLRHKVRCCVSIVLHLRQERCFLLS